MAYEVKMINPLFIRVGNHENILMKDSNVCGSVDMPLSPGILIGGEHYGFIILSDKNKFHREVAYKTQFRITAVGIEDNVLKIYEDRKLRPWRFSKKGDLIEDQFDPYADDTYSSFDDEKIVKEDLELFLDEPTIKDPLMVTLTDDYKWSTLNLKDESLLLINGVMLGPTHYGFILNRNGISTAYKTCLPVDGIAFNEGYKPPVLEVYEYGKHHPWIFTSDGDLIEKPNFEKSSKTYKNLIKDIASGNIDIRRVK